MSFQCAYISIVGRLYHINSEINMHIYSIFGRLYHIYSEINMHIFSIFSRITLTDIFLCTLLHLAGCFFIFRLKSEDKRKNAFDEEDEDDENTVSRSSSTR